MEEGQFTDSNRQRMNNLMGMNNYDSNGMNPPLLAYLPLMMEEEEKEGGNTYFSENSQEQYSMPQILDPIIEEEDEGFGYNKTISDKGTRRSIEKGKPPTSSK